MTYWLIAREYLKDHCLMSKSLVRKKGGFKMAITKYSSWMAAFILGLGIVGYIPVKEAITEKPVDKKVILAIYKTKRL